ncbi:probable carboxylesterase 6 [Beta vulgaris subsp. vulgaris]|uniref:probable carboxylesterase 6 n=1 Tax=Beta vulgaris subsp. vulgaris TaxID=3555 RepID=UPI0020367C55|nr:probable carboxylesterase 6 [Beta vulgaris subsp. vulgaris]
MVVSKPTKMVAMDLDQNLGLKSDDDRGSIIEEIKGLIKLYKDGYVERSLKAMSCVSPFLAPDLQVNARDVFIDKITNIWARVYVPKCNNQDYYTNNKLPIIVYFHGGGFCVGSTAWKSYHNFLGNLASKARCVIVSVNYRLAPEDPLPAAYEDGMKALMWVKQQETMGQNSEFWAKYSDFSSIFLAGDSSGANLAYNVALKLGTSHNMPLIVKGIILVQPFFGGEERTNSELIKVQSCKSALSLAANDTYWRLAMPSGANRDHPWCNSLRKDTKKLENMRVMVCIAEKDILRDRNLELCTCLAKNVGNEVEYVISEGVGHGFQILDESQFSQNRKKEMVSHIVEFVSKYTR